MTIAAKACDKEIILNASRTYRKLYISYDEQAIRIAYLYKLPIEIFGYSKGSFGLCVPEMEIGIQTAIAAEHGIALRFQIRDHNG